MLYIYALPELVVVAVSSVGAPTIAYDSVIATADPNKSSAEVPKTLGLVNVNNKVPCVSYM